jgi:hypothetical protein
MNVKCLEFPERTIYLEVHNYLLANVYSRIKSAADQKPYNLLYESSEVTQNIHSEVSSHFGF